MHAEAKINRYLMGIKKLAETTALVKKLKENLLESQPVLEQATKETQNLMDVLEQDRQVRKKKRKKKKILSYIHSLRCSLSLQSLSLFSSSLSLSRGFANHEWSLRALLA